MRILIAWPGRAISFILFHGPQFLRTALAYILAFLWFDLFRIRRQVVLGNLHIAFPNLSLRERVKLGRRSLRHLALNFVEYSYLPWLTPENFKDHFVIENADLLKQALARGNGALLVTLHLGNGDLALAALSLYGFPTAVVSKAFKLKWLNDAWFGMRARLGTRFIPARNSSYALLKALKGGAAVLIPLDQFTGPPIGVRTTFFGKETGTAAGLAVMAQRSGAPVIAVFTHRDSTGRHILHVVREIQVGKTDNPEKPTQTFNDELEKYVRLHPEQWMWIHRRWKEFVV